MTLKLTELPRGVRGGEVTIPADQSEGWLPITVDRGVSNGELSARAVVTAGRTRLEVAVSILVRPTAR